LSFLGKILIKTLQAFPYVKALENRIHNFEKYTCFEPGHYYSALADPAEYIEQQKLVINSDKYEPLEIDFNTESQLSLLHSFEDYYKDFPFDKPITKNLRYKLDNVFFTYSDALSMYSMIRHFKPKKIIEIGSGFSSALILDTNQLFFEGKIDLTFIDPNPERFRANIKEKEYATIITEKIQHVDQSIFKELDKGDFLLIDTSHVSKSGSDVNHIYFNIIPLLRKGVKIHVHDIFFPFEYPENWIVEERRSWNEVYLVRSLLAYSTAFKIIWFNTYMENKFKEIFEKKTPLFLKRNSTVCGGIWIEKVI
jgi:predicted O-methyltransferase YrrM